MPEEEQETASRKCESVSQEYEVMRMQPNELNTAVLPLCETVGGKSGLLDGVHLNPTSICLNEQSNDEKALEEIVQKKKALKPTRWSPPKRFVFTGLGFFGMVMLYALRVNLSVAIVSMVRTSNSTKQTLNESQASQFDWDENTQGLVLGSFFWGYVISQLPGGRLADSFGSKWLLGFGIFMTSVLTIVSPLAANWSYKFFLVCRILEGVFEGVVIPAMHSMIAKWFPPQERSIAAGIIYSGSMIGTVLAMPISAYLCASTFLGGWPAVFYMFGLVGVLWSVFWFIFVSETPQTHPTISQQELRMILSSQNHSASKKKPSIPWKSILTSVPLWALATTHFGQNWGFYTMLTQMPRYFKSVLDFDLKSNGIYSALPYLSQALVAISMGFLCDHLFRSGRISLPTLRKSFNSTAFAGTAICLFLVTLIGRDRLWSIILLVLALGINGMSMAGFTPTHVDMSPNFAGSLMGITNCIANFAGVFAPMAVGQILSLVVGDENSPGAAERTLEAWHYIFYLSAVIYAFTGAVYVLFGSNTVQPWNDPQEESNVPSRYAKKVDE